MALDVKLTATPEAARGLLSRAAVELGLRAEGMVDSDLGPCLVVRNSSAPIGKAFLWPLPTGCLLHVPKGRGAEIPARAWNSDPAGTVFGGWIAHSLQIFHDLALVSRKGRLASEQILDTARKQLASAEDATGFAAIGNVCRSALVALGNEVFGPHMLPTGGQTPKADDADSKLKHAAKHFAAGSSARQANGLAKAIEGIWGIASALTHRKSATREDAEVCLLLTEALVDAFAAMTTRTNGDQH